MRNMTGTVQTLEIVAKIFIHRLRPLAYHGTSVFMALFSVADRKSFDLLLNKYIPEVRQHCSAPIVIVASKTDLRGGYLL